MSSQDLLKLAILIGLYRLSLHSNLCKVNSATCRFANGKLNVSYNCIDRHIEAGHGDRTAVIWEGDEPGTTRTVSFTELRRLTCKIANVLKSKGVRKGDVVTLYMPMIPELAITMLACSRIGAVHSVVFAGFSAESLRYTFCG
jgi:acetyl-CoA synthetase